MVPNLIEYYSHPNKSLLKHTDGVINNVNGLTNSKLAELVAIFHDLGKMNPNFQAKLSECQKDNGYSNHAYISAYVFFCTFVGSSFNKTILKRFLGMPELTENDIVAISVLIAKHHGNIPDFQPIDYDHSGITILSKKKNEGMISFISKIELPFEKYVETYIPIDKFEECIKNIKYQECYINRLCFQTNENDNALNFFIDYQHAFACLIQGDKVDAAGFDNFISKQKDDIDDFSKIYTSNLDSYLQLLPQNTLLNILRTQIRKESVDNISKGLSGNNRVFELTAPTGSGKTLMLLSLASEIIKNKGSKRIIYALPFLSITEQVENEVLKIFKGNERYVQRIDSKSENKQYEKLQERLDNEPNEDVFDEMRLLDFQENTFSYPFIITTFVRFFETLLSNRNSELLKLPNFSNCIFLLDEIQSLPPRLYGFFVAYISRFCEKFNSYAVISTATQPNFELPSYDDNIKEFFNNYHTPFPLLPLSYFNNDLFSRYSITINNECIDLEHLKNELIEENKSTLVILNTIDDTKELYALLKEDIDKNDLILLNTHFTPRDRKIKIYLAKRKLREKKRVIVISTQLIEAGVDIDFPLVYRDYATVSSIVQSAGRCNRNGKLPDLGKVILFKLKNKGKVRSELIYRGKDKDLLTFTKEALVEETYNEKDLLTVQKSFFDKIQKQLFWGKYGEKLENDFLKDIKECMYAKIGKFQLIDKQIFGEELQYYVAKNERDNKFELLLQKQEELFDLFRKKADISTIKSKKKEIVLHIKKMSNQIVQIRLKSNQIKPLLGHEKSYYNLFKIDKKCYSFIGGVDLKSEECIL